MLVCRGSKNVASPFFRIAWASYRRAYLEQSRVTRLIKSKNSLENAPPFYERPNIRRRMPLWRCEVSGHRRGVPPDPLPLLGLPKGKRGAFCLLGFFQGAWFLVQPWPSHPAALGIEIADFLQPVWHPTDVSGRRRFGGNRCDDLQHGSPGAVGAPGSHLGGRSIALDQALRRASVLRASARNG